MFLNHSNTKVEPPHAVVGLFYQPNTDSVYALHADGSIKDVGYSEELMEMCQRYMIWQQGANGWSQYASAYDRACQKFFDAVQA